MSNNIEYLVERAIDLEWRVMNRNDDSQLFKGTLLDCESFIKLSQAGYM